MNELIRYVVQSEDGKYFKNFKGHDPNWVDNINDSRVYAKLGGPRSLMTWFMKNRPNDKVNLVKITSTSLEIIDEADRLKKVKEKDAKYIRMIQERNRINKENELKNAEELVTRLKNELF